MTTLTTHDCKKFLVKTYQENKNPTNISEWKRTKKYLVEGKNYRDFYHNDIGEITLKEDNGILTIVPQGVPKSSINKKPTMASLYEGMSDLTGDKLVRNCIEKTIESYTEMFSDNPHSYTLISHNLHGDDGYGNTASCYYYESDGRDISLIVYNDQSWIISSD